MLYIYVRIPKKHLTCDFGITASDVYKRFMKNTVWKVSVSVKMKYEKVDIYVILENNFSSSS